MRTFKRWIKWLICQISGHSVKRLTVQRLASTTATLPVQPFYCGYGRPVVCERCETAWPSVYAYVER